LVRYLLASQRRAANRGHLPQHIELTGRSLGQFEKCRSHFVRNRARNECDTPNQQQQWQTEGSDAARRGVIEIG
jgi:hypothetical protein